MQCSGGGGGGGGEDDIRACMLFLSGLARAELFLVVWTRGRVQSRDIELFSWPPNSNEVLSGSTNDWHFHESLDTRFGNCKLAGNQSLNSFPSACSVAARKVAQANADPAARKKKPIDQ
jgi:hypothetical protein